MERWESILRACNQNLGGRTAETWRESRAHLGIRRPFWAAKALPYLPDESEQELLFRRGTAVTAYFVSANSHLRRIAPSDLPGNVVYSPDPWFAAHPDDLEEIGDDVFDTQSGHGDDEEVEALAELVRLDDVPIERREVPRSLTGGRQVWIATVLLARKHVPGGFLARFTVPLLVAPEESKKAMVLPSRYWPEALVRRWERAKPRSPCPDHESVVVAGYAWPVPVIVFATFLVINLLVTSIAGTEFWRDNASVQALGVAGCGAALLGFARFETVRGPRRYLDPICAHPIDVTHDRRILWLGPRVWGWMLVAIAGVMLVVDLVGER